MRIILLLSLLFPLYLNAAEVYKSIGPNGAVIYSDQPSKGAIRIDIVPAPASPPPPQQAQPQPAAPPSADNEPENPAQSYEGVEILSPKQDAVVRDNPGNVSLLVRVKPELQAAHGDRLRIEMDGVLLEGRFSGSQLHLKNVDRGTHKVVVEVVDEQGEVLVRSAPRSFHMKRHSILNP